MKIVLPTALPGLITGSLLAVARAAGETAPLLFTATIVNGTTFNLGERMNSLPVQIYTDVGSPNDQLVAARLGLGAGAGHPDPPHHPRRAARVAQEPTLVTRPDTKTMTDDPRTTPPPATPAPRTAARADAAPSRARRGGAGGAAGAPPGISVTAACTPTTATATRSRTCPSTTPPTRSRR